MKRIFLLLTILSALCADAQIVNRFRDSTVFYGSVRTQALLQMTGKSIVQDTSLYIVSGNDTLRLTTSNDTTKIQSKSGGINFDHNGNTYLIANDSFTLIKAAFTQSLPSILAGNATQITGSDSAIIAYGDTATIGGYILLDGFVEYLALDSNEIYNSNVSDGVMTYCYDCTGNGITGRFLMRIGAAWRRLLFD